MRRCFNSNQNSGSLRHSFTVRMHACNPVRTHMHTHMHMRKTKFASFESAFCKYRLGETGGRASLCGSKQSQRPAAWSAPCLVPGGQQEAYVIMRGEGSPADTFGEPWMKVPPKKIKTSPGSQAQTRWAHLDWRCAMSASPK